MSDAPPRSPQSYPLSALFVLMAGCAVVTALLTPVVSAISVGLVGIPEAVGASVGGTILVTFIGFTVGSHHVRRVRGIFWGILTGALLGTVLGPVALAPAAAFPTLLLMSGVGALLLVGLGAAFRLSAR